MRTSSLIAPDVAIERDLSSYYDDIKLIADNMEQILDDIDSRMDIRIYDKNANKIVDNSEKVNGLTVETAVPENALFTDTVYDDTILAAIVALNTAKRTYPLIDEQKMATIEEGSTGDQTAVEIKTLYESNANTNVFNDTWLAKLTAIEANATQDQTGAEIKALYITQLKAFTDTLYDKLALIEDSATADQTALEIKTLYESNTDTNEFNDVEKIKLAAIEDNATSDQTNSEIKIAYEANANTNVFDDAAQSKLGGIEPLATADQTDGEVKTAYENNANTNEFSDSEKAKLAALESSHFKGQYASLTALNTAHPTASIGDYANVDLGVGEEVLRYAWDSDDTVWVQQLGSSNILTDAEVKTQYENNANTNAYTDTEKSKLSGIENNATEDQTATEIETLYEGIADTNKFTDGEQQSIIDHETLIGINAQAIANLATAQGIVTGVQTLGYVHEPMPAVWTQMVFDTTTPSTDSDVFEIDDVANTITFKINASFNCNNAIAVESVTPSEVTLQCRIVNVADDSVLITRDAIITLPNGTISYLDVLELLTIGRNGMPSAPVTLRMEVREVTSSYNMISFRSVVTSSSSYDVSTSHEGLSGRDVADSHPMSAITGLLTNLPIPVFPQDEGLPLVAKSTGAVYEEILGLPDETDQTGKSITNLGTKKSSFWSNVTCNPIVMTEDQVIPDGVSASVVSGFTIPDGITLTIPDGSVLSVV